MTDLDRKREHKEMHEYKSTLQALQYPKEGRVHRHEHLYGSSPRHLLTIPIDEGDGTRRAARRTEDRARDTRDCDEHACEETCDVAEAVARIEADRRVCCNSVVTGARSLVSAHWPREVLSASGGRTRILY